MFTAEWVGLFDHGQEIEWQELAVYITVSR